MATYHVDSQPRFVALPGRAYAWVTRLANSRISIMGKRHPHFPAWQWRTCLDHHGHPSNPVLHQIAVPLFIVAFLLMVSGVFSLSLANVAIGSLGMIAALVLQCHGHEEP
ncbi:hypothetical protein GKKCFE_06950 [Pseudomonas sp. E141]|jgi:hypothetical protein